MNIYIRNNKGFTLIELLIVVAIVSLLSSIVFASVSAARIKGRDARRMQDLHQIQLALNLYYGDNGHYPSSSGAWLFSCDSTWATFQTFLTPYMKTLPTDPVNSSSPCGGSWNVGFYSYTYSSSGGDKYDLFTAMENTSSPYRCAVKKYLFHDWGGESLWCGSNWDQLYADH